MPEQAEPESVEACILADADRATADARNDALCAVRYYQDLIDGGIPDELAADLCRAWNDSYLDSDIAEV